MAKLVYALDLGSSAREGVGVRVPPFAPNDYFDCVTPLERRFGRRELSEWQNLIQGEKIEDQSC